MLIEFRVENHRSLRDEQALSMEAGRAADGADDRPRQVDGVNEKLLCAAGLYGANASGKTNVLAALAFMRDAVFSSHRSWSPDEGVPREQFAWGPKKDEPSLFEVTIVLESIRYQYGFVASDKSFLEEWLHAWPLGKKQIWFERDASTFKFGDNLKGENKLIEEVTRPNALFLSAAVQHKHVQLQPIFSWFRALNSYNLPPTRHSLYRPWLSEFAVARLLEGGTSDPTQQQLFQNEESTELMLERFRSMLRNADIGITDLRILKDEGPNELSKRQRAPRFQLKHQSDSLDSWLPLEEESRGTRTLFRLAFPILQAIQGGGTLIIDELEASLHPALAEQIVRQFNNPSTNPNNAQLIFTTHDTNLLGTTLGMPALRRDQIWLTEKSPEGATEVYPLTDYKPRKLENLERGYLQGRYGAIPFLGNFSFGE